MTNSNEQPTGWLRTLGRLAVLALAVAAGYWLRGPAPPQVVQDRHDHDHDHSPSHNHDHDHDHDDPVHADHDHSHEDDVTMVELSEQAKGNIGLKVSEAALGSFTRTVTLPAIVVERPGRSQIDVAAPLTGVVTAIHVIAGQAVEPGQPLFDMRLTHEELVQSQSEFLRTLEELDVVQRDIKRLEGVAEKGAIAGKVVLEREYERQKLEAALRAQEQGLMLHGLSAESVAEIRASRKLLGTLSIRAPQPPEPRTGDEPWLLQVERLNVEIGHHINAGEPLCQLNDHTVLYVEGRAFPEDAELLNRAAQSGADVCALLETGAATRSDQVCNLKILYLGSKIDPESRVLSCFATLPNEMIRDDRDAEGRRFIGWRFLPGQRMQLQAPVETWDNRIVLPVEAVVQEGPESYVFREDGDHFHRCPVQIEYRDPFNVVLAPGNEISAGDRLAMNSAQQLQLVLKNRSGGGAEAHHDHPH